MFNEIINFIRELYKQPVSFIPLHEPKFIGNERAYVLQAIDSTYVSSTGQYVNEFERMLCQLTGAKFCVATVNGTSALHMALLLAGVKRGEEVLTQAFTFVATANAISYTGAEPIFVDIDLDTLGLSPIAVKDFLEENALLKGNTCYNKKTGKKIAACVPMHTFGFPIHLEELLTICNEYYIPVVEDSAESLGSYYKEKHTGTYGLIGAFSFNGNKIITCGGGGALITHDEDIAARAKHMTTTAKISHPWRYTHDDIGFNYRMPNLNAALACAQMEQIDFFLKRKRILAQKYLCFFEKQEVIMKEEPDNTKANYWLNSIILNNKKERDLFLQFSNDHGVMTRPAWDLMNKLKMYGHCQTGKLENSAYVQDRLVNIPSSVII